MKAALALAVLAGTAHADPADVVAAYLHSELAGETLDARLAVELANPAGDDGFAEAIRAAALAGRIATARAAFATWPNRPDTIELRLLAIELALIDAPAGDRYDVDARAGCAEPVLGTELWCHQRVHWRTPSIRRMRVRALDPAATDLDWLSGAIPAERDLGNAIARGLGEAHATCSVAHPIVVAITVAAASARELDPLSISVHTDDPWAGDCVWRVMSGLALPASAHALAHPITTEVSLVTLPKLRPIAPARDRGDGAMAFAYVRGGARAGNGLGFDARYDLGHGGRRAVLAGRTTFGVAVDGSRSYGAYAEAGFELATTKHIELALTSGIGVARDGDAAPRHVEIPVDIRVRFETSIFRGVSWVQFDSTSTVIGFGAGFPAAGLHVFVAAGLENHVNGSGGFAMIGIPLGAAY